MKENDFQHSFIEQIECFKVQFFTDIVSSNSKLPKCDIAVFCDMFIAQVDIAMMIKKKDPLCSPNANHSSHSLHKLAMLPISSSFHYSLNVSMLLSSGSLKKDNICLQVQPGSWPLLAQILIIYMKF